MPRPVLVFLHGLLGSRADWQKLCQNLPHFDCICLDLPFHGAQKAVTAIHDFDSVCAYLAAQIHAAVDERPYFLVGYSLGGRLALYYALAAPVARYGLQGLILEGANFGLQTEAERQARWAQDQHWATRFAQEPPESVLNDWYQQAVFAHLSPPQRADLIAQRAENCGENIARMLAATSLAKLPDFRAKVRAFALPLFYFCGERDEKFRRHAAEAGLSPIVIDGAGHNAHRENPQQFAEKLTALFAPS